MICRQLTRCRLYCAPLLTASSAKFLGNAGTAAPLWWWTRIHCRVRLAPLVDQTAHTTRQPSELHYPRRLLLLPQRDRAQFKVQVVVKGSDSPRLSLRAVSSSCSFCSHVLVKRAETFACVPVLVFVLAFSFSFVVTWSCPSRNSFSQSSTVLTSTRLHDVQASPDWIGLHLPVCQRGNPATFSPSLVSRCKPDLQVPKCRLRVVSLVHESPNIEPVVTHYRLVHGQCWTVQKVGCPCCVP